MHVCWTDVLLSVSALADGREGQPVSDPLGDAAVDGVIVRDKAREQADERLVVLCVVEAEVADALRERAGPPPVNVALVVLARKPLRVRVGVGERHGRAEVVDAPGLSKGRVLDAREHVRVQRGDAPHKLAHGLAEAQGSGQVSPERVVVHVPWVLGVASRHAGAQVPAVDVVLPLVQRTLEVGRVDPCHRLAFLE